MLKKRVILILTVILALSLLSACGSASRKPFTGFRFLKDRDEVIVGPTLTGEEITVTLSDEGSRCSGPGVQIADGTVTFVAAGEYVLTGSLSDGQIIVKAPDTAKVRLLLNGVSIVKNGHAAIYALSADSLEISTLPDSESFLQSTGEFIQTDGNRVDAAVFSKCDLRFDGSGVLNISSLTGHAVVSKDALRLKGGTLNLEAAYKGFCGKDGVHIDSGTLHADVGTDGICAVNSEDSGKGTIRIDGGSIRVLCQKDGMDASGDINLTGGDIMLNAGSGREGKGICSDADIDISGSTLQVNSMDDAIHASGSVLLSGGTVLLSTMDDGVHADDTLEVSGGGLIVSQCFEGLEAKVITISGGETSVIARDDGLCAAGGSDSSDSKGLFGGDPFTVDKDASLTITGGTVLVNAEGDGLDSNGYLHISGGTILISGPANGDNSAIDYGVDASVTGGTLIAASAAGMSENFGKNSSQGSILITLSSAQEAGSEIYLLDSRGKLLASFTPEKSYRSVLISIGSLSIGESYTIVAGKEEQSITLSSLIYGSGDTIGAPGGSGGPGARPDGPRPDDLPPVAPPDGGLDPRPENGPGQN